MFLHVASGGSGGNGGTRIGVPPVHGAYGGSGSGIAAGGGGGGSGDRWEGWLNVAPGESLSIQVLGTGVEELEAIRGTVTMAEETLGRWVSHYRVELMNDSN